METYCVSCKKNTVGIANQVLEKLNKIDWCFYQKLRTPLSSI